MKTEIQIKIAESSDIEWVNARYDEVGFVHSNYQREMIAIAQSEGQRAGLARLVKIDEKHLELGGVYVFEAFRSKGVARELVLFLLRHKAPLQTIYCIPFEHLVFFYEQCGFKVCKSLNEVPEEIVKKSRWCQEKYTQPTSLMVLSGCVA